MSEYDPTDVNAQEAARESQDRERKQSKDTEESDFKWLMKSKRGRRIVWRVLDQCGVFRMSFNTNAMQMSFNEGNRNTGNRLLSMITNTAPDDFVLMLSESKEPDEAVL